MRELMFKFGPRIRRWLPIVAILAALLSAALAGGADSVNDPGSQWPL